MTSIPDDKLFEHAHRVKDKVVIITGAANGIGKETAKRYAESGAKVVIGDLIIADADTVVQEIEQSGGQASAIKCDVTIWEDVLALFEFTMTRYGAVDIVVANAGISNAGGFGTIQLKDGKPIKPSLKIIDVNLIGVIYTTHLALHYLTLNRTSPDSLKSIILLGSIASWIRIPLAPMYTASKHAVLGMMRSIHDSCARDNIRIASIHPWFADTAILPLPIKVFLVGVPLTPISRIAGAIFYASTDPDPATNGSGWLLPDDGPVFLVPQEEFKMGVYGMIDQRYNRLVKGLTGIGYYVRLTNDIIRLFGKQVLITGLGAAAAKVSWDNRELLGEYIRSVIG